MTTTVTTEQDQVHKIPGYMRRPTLGFVGMLYSIMDCVGNISWLISLQTAELFQVYEKRITVFNRGYIGQVLQLHKECTWNLTPTELAFGIFYKLTGRITNLHENYIIRILRCRPSRCL